MSKDQTTHEQLSEKQRESLFRSIFSRRSVNQRRLDMPTSPACEALENAFLFLRNPIQPLADVADAESMQEAVSGLSDGIGVLIRETSIEGDWWQKSGEPLIVVHEEIGPCFVFHRRGRWHGVRANENGRRIDSSIDARFAERCEETAHELIPMPKPGPIKPTELIRVAMTGRWSDLWIRLGAASGAAAVGIVLPLMIAIVIDSIIPNGDVRGLVGVAAALVVAIIANALLLTIAGLATTRVDNSLTYRIEAILLFRILAHGRSKDDLAAGEIMQRISAVNYAMVQITAATSTIVVQIVRGLANLGVLFLFSWVFGIVGLVTVTITSSLLFIDFALQRRYSFASEEAYGRSKSNSIRILEGMDSASDRGILDRLLDRWQQHTVEAKFNYYRSNTVSQTRTLIDAMIGGGGRILLYAVTAYALVDDMTIGAFVASLGAMTVVLASVTQTGTLVSTLSQTQPIFQRLKPLLQTSRPGTRGSGGIDPHGDFRIDEAPLLPENEIRQHRADLAIEAGKLTVIAAERPRIAQNLLGMLTGVEPSIHRVLYDWTPIEEIEGHAFRRNLSTLVSRPRPTGGSVRCDLDIDRNLDDETMLESLREVDWDFDATKGSPLDQILDPKQTSLLDAYKIAAARMILNRREVSIIMDNSLLRVTDWGRRLVSEVADRSGTRIIATLAPEVMARADRVLVIDENGDVLANGPPAEVGSRTDLPAWVKEAFQ